MRIIWGSDLGCGEEVEEPGEGDGSAAFGSSSFGFEAD